VRLRREIAQGTYETPARFEAALDAFLDQSEGNGSGPADKGVQSPLAQRVDDRESPFAQRKGDRESPFATRRGDFKDPWRPDLFR